VSRTWKALAALVGAEDVVTATGSGRPDKHGGRHGNLDGEGRIHAARRMQRVSVRYCLPLLAVTMA